MYSPEMIQKRRDNLEAALVRKERAADRLYGANEALTKARREYEAAAQAEIDALKALAQLRDEVEA